MTCKPVRIALLVATLVASLQVAAAPRYWTLTDVELGGLPVTGYFSYDDVTQTVSNWNVRVGTHWWGVTFPAFTFLPGNSTSIVGHSAGSPTTSVVVVSEFVALKGAQRGIVELEIGRTLDLFVRMPLDGSTSTVPLDPDSGERFSVFGIGLPALKITGGSLTLASTPPPVLIVQVEEFYYAPSKHYFLSADSEEKQWLESAGWTRTGESFKAYAAGSNTGGSVNPVCRFYSPPRRLINDSEYYDGSDSHFFSADVGECMTVAEVWWFAWQFEGDNRFQVDLPNRMTGACPPGTLAVYRVSNRAGDGSHRYTTSVATRADHLTAGYVAEGYGPDGVAMCAVA